MDGATETSIFANSVKLEQNETKKQQKILILTSEVQPSYFPVFVTFLFLVFLLYI